MSYWAYVKYVLDNKKEVVPVSKIKIDKKPYRPTSLEDFDVNKKYSVKTLLDSKDGKERRYYAQIGRLAGKFFFSIFTDEKKKDTENL